MTTINCEHCGPTRIAPHDTKCPTRITEEFMMLGERRRKPRPVWPFQTRGPIKQEFGTYNPAPYLVPDPEHRTIISDTRAPNCACGYDPAFEHPEAEPGRLFAYIGQHIKNVNEAART